MQGLGFKALASTSMFFGGMSFLVWLQNGSFCPPTGIKIKSLPRTKALSCIERVNARDL